MLQLLAYMDVLFLFSFVRVNRELGGREGTLEWPVLLTHFIQRPHAGGHLWNSVTHWSRGSIVCATSTRFHYAHAAPLKPNCMGENLEAGRMNWRCLSWLFLVMGHSSTIVAASLHLLLLVCTLSMNKHAILSLPVLDWSGRWRFPFSFCLSPAPPSPPLQTHTHFFVVLFFPQQLDAFG